MNISYGYDGKMPTEVLDFKTNSETLELVASTTNKTVLVGNTSTDFTKLLTGGDWDEAISELSEFISSIGGDTVYIQRLTRFRYMNRYSYRVYYS